MFDSEAGGPGVQDAFLTLCERAGVPVRIPHAIASLCCGTPWKSKGLSGGLATMRGLTLPALQEATEEGALPVIVDAASCTEGLAKLLAEDPRLRVMDVVEFVDAAVLPELRLTHRLESVVLHPTCSSTSLGINDALARLGAAIADEVVVPEDWGCCGFAGDRGLLHPELTASATAAEARQAKVAGTAYASVNRTCEIGMTRATGHPYGHILELLTEVTKP
jgi:D-lactate dehydrogenase